MPESTPDLSDESRCVSVHWSLPVQCVLPCTHQENWHEAWHPSSGNRIRYRRTFGVYRTEELRDGSWHTLELPPPSVDLYSSPDLKAIQARVDAATDEQWIHMCLGTEGCVVLPAAKTLRERAKRVAMFGYRDWDEDHANAEFTAAARTDVPALLAEVTRLRARVDVLTDQVAGSHETIQRVRDLHKRFDDDADCMDADSTLGCRHGQGAHRFAVCEYDQDDWPCATIRSLDGDPADASPEPSGLIERIVSLDGDPEGEASDA